MIRRLVAGLDSRLGAAPFVKKVLRYVFPDHWSFMLGEIALYAFVVLVATGIPLTLFFEASYEQTTYGGSYEPLRGLEMTKAYESSLDISFDITGGLLLRQTHHWAANVFVVAIVLHLVRIVLTGAFRKPRDLNYYIGVTMLGLAIFEGYLGYSLLDDLLSGMGLAIGYSVVLSIPVVGSELGFLIWGGQFPGADVFPTRLLITHVLIVPVALAVLISLHMLILTRQKHTQFPGPGRTERNVVGTPLWPGYALRSIGLLFAVAAVLVLLGGLVQINPIWLWGPYEPYLSTNGAQPDWYLGWLIGALRLMPAFEPTIGGYTLVPNAFWGGLLFPTIVFAVLYGIPSIDRRLTRDRRRHELLDRPRDNPRRTALFSAFLAWVFIAFFVGASDRVFVQLDIPYEGQIWFFRVALFVLPVVVYALVLRICRELEATEAHPFRGLGGEHVRRTEGGGFEAVARDAPLHEPGPTDRAGPRRAS